MIFREELNNDTCYVCKRHLVVDRSTGSESFVYVHFTNKYDLNRAGQFMPSYLYFCPSCWRDTAGEDFVAEGWDG